MANEYKSVLTERKKQKEEIKQLVEKMIAKNYN